MAQKALLELTTDAPERATIKVDGKEYQLRAREDLGLKEDAEFRRTMKEFGDGGPDTDWPKMARLLDGLVRTAVLDIPDEVLAKLKDVQKVRIVEAFTKEVVSSRQAASAAEEAGKAAMAA
jgi:hypothetical protein